MRKNLPSNLPIITVEIVIFSLIEQQLSILMVKQVPPFSHFWGLPIGEVDCKQDTTLEQTAKRNIKSFTGIDPSYLEQVQTIGNNERYPKRWSIAVVYYALISSEFKLIRGSNVSWMPINQALSLELCFDHNQIIKNCLHRLQNKSLYTSLPIFLLPKEFTLTELQKTYELILDFKMEKKSFRRRLLGAGFLKETGQTRKAKHRPALLYQLTQMQPYYFGRIIEGVRESKDMEQVEQRKQG